MLLGAVLQLGLGLGLVAVGRWGRAHAAELPAVTLPPEERSHLAVVYRRGAGACVVLGLALCAVTLAFAVVGRV